MWKRLDEKDLIEAYHKEFLNKEDVPSGFSKLLLILNKEPFANKVWAVTSLQNLRFTTSPSYLYEDKHPHIHVAQKGNVFSLSYFLPKAKIYSDSSNAEWDEFVITVKEYIYRML